MNTPGYVTETVIETHGLSKSYKGVQALKAKIGGREDLHQSALDRLVRGSVEHLHIQVSQVEQTQIAKLDHAGLGGTGGSDDADRAAITER